MANEVNSEEHALARVSGYILFKTIGKDSCKCDKCKNYFIAKDDDQQAVNELIDYTDYKPGALTRPSKDANEVFKMAETIFRCNRHKICKEPRMGERMTNLILSKIPHQFGNLPECHLKLVFSRFVKVRFYFWTNFENSIAQREEKFRIIGESNSSLSMKARYLRN